MENKDMPINPVPFSDVIDFKYIGLTKLEKLSMEIYVKVIGKVDTEIEDTNLEFIAKESIRAAKIFFDELENNSVDKNNPLI